MSGSVILPLLIDADFTVDIDNLRDWARAEWLIGQKRLDMVQPPDVKRPIPEQPELVVFDF